MPSVHFLSHLPAVSGGQQGPALGTTTASFPAPPNLGSAVSHVLQVMFTSSSCRSPQGTPQATTPKCTADTHIGHAVLDLGTPHLCLELCEVQVGLALGPAEKGQARDQPRVACFQALLTGKCGRGPSTSFPFLFQNILLAGLLTSLCPLLKASCSRAGTLMLIHQMLFIECQRLQVFHGGRSILEGEKYRSELGRGGRGLAQAEEMVATKSPQRVRVGAFDKHEVRMARAERGAKGGGLVP